MDRNDILDITETLFATKNVHFTLAELSEKLNIKPPSLYNHFKSKEEIIKFTIIREYENLNQYIDCIFDKAIYRNAVSTLEHYFKTIISYFDEYQKVRFWRQYSLLTNEEKDQYSLNRMHLENHLQEQLDRIFDKLASEYKLSEQSKDDMHIMIQIIIQGIVEMRLMNSGEIQIESIKEISWRNYLDTLKNNL